MIKSMTGFGRAEASDSDRKITIEMKSVNHRYFEQYLRNILTAVRLIYL